jgi:hypothetical protein
VPALPSWRAEPLWERLKAIADTTPATTIRNRCDERIQLGVFARLKQIALESYGRITGLVVDQIAVDGTITKALEGGEIAGSSPIDRSAPADTTPPWPAGPAAGASLASARRMPSEGADLDHLLRCNSSLTSGGGGWSQVRAADGDDLAGDVVVGHEEEGRVSGSFVGAEVAEGSGRSRGGDRLVGVQSGPRAQEWGADPTDADDFHG